MTNSPRRIIPITLTEQEYQESQVYRKEGETWIGIYRRGLAACRVIIKRNQNILKIK